MANVKLENVISSLQKLKNAHGLLEKMVEQASGEEKEKLSTIAKDIWDVGQDIYTTAKVNTQPGIERLQTAAELVRVMVQYPLTLSFGEVNGNACTVVSAFNPELKEALPIAILIDRSYVELAEADLNFKPVPAEVNAELEARYNNQHPEVKKSTGASN